MSRVFSDSFSATSLAHPSTSTATPPAGHDISVSIEIHRHSEDSQTRCWSSWTLVKQSYPSQPQLTPIDILPDDVLLEIFDIYTRLEYGRGYKNDTESWQSLIHVCQQWRNVVFASPRRLDLQIFCTPAILARNRLDVWPALLPLVIWGCDMTRSSLGTDNVIAALGQSNRVRKVTLTDLAGWQVELVFAVMQVPFPELTHLELSSRDEMLPLIPDSFLDGSAPRLRYFRLDGIPFPELPRLLLSAPHLVYLRLIDIPYSGYISPEAIVALLSVLSRLEFLSLRFRSPQSRLDRESRRSPPPKRSVIPALVSFRFKGATEYLEDLISSIDAPQLGRMDIMLFNQVDFDTLRLTQFINRTFKLAKPDTRVQFNDDHVQLLLGALEMGISCREPDWQLSSIEQVCNSCFHPLSTVEDLRIDYQYEKLVWKDDPIEDTLWLQLLLPFTAAKNLYLAKEFSQGIAAALVGGGITGVLPSLQNIFVAGNGRAALGRFQKTIGQFIAARQLSGHPVTVSDWDIDR